MRSNLWFIVLVLFLAVQSPAMGQANNLLRVKDTTRSAYNPNRPANAAFYSAVVPGLGQLYNRDYWKIPIVYAALGTGVYIFLDRQNEYLELREAYRSRLSGRRNDRFIDDQGNVILTLDGLERGQQVAQRNKELALLITAAVYLLNIIEANVSGHLSQFNTDRNLSLRPMIDYGNLTYGSSYGLIIQYTF
jgi:hypothetical protein